MLKVNINPGWEGVTKLSFRVFVDVYRRACHLWCYWRARHQRCYLRAHRQWNYVELVIKDFFKFKLLTVMFLETMSENMSSLLWKQRPCMACIWSWPWWWLSAFVNAILSYNQPLGNWVISCSFRGFDETLKGQVIIIRFHHWNNVWQTNLDTCVYIFIYICTFWLFCFVFCWFCLNLKWIF